MGAVDYIWHSEELVPVRVLETIPIDILRRTRGLPTEKWVVTTLHLNVNSLLQTMAMYLDCFTMQFQSCIFHILEGFLFFLCTILLLLRNIMRPNCEMHVIYEAQTLQNSQCVHVVHMSDIFLGDTWTLLIVFYSFFIYL
ncbi:unnamed protein product [Lupinus luteus]|uniref:Uncharacterized protein n=1 Tax=Lupinus luteus TaxID=3873 RepID=A0AAV1WK95_LUPLU